MDLLQTTRNRILQEMLRPLSTLKKKYKVLIMDTTTTRLMSQLFKDYEIYEEYISKLESLHSRRSPNSRIDAIYYIQPSIENVKRLVKDIQMHFYKMMYVFFSTPIEEGLLKEITKKQSILMHIGGLKEINLEYFVVNNQAFTTNNNEILNYMLGENICEGLSNVIDTIATRLVTVFASMKEFPHVRYQIGLNDDATFNDCISTKVAAAFWNELIKRKEKFPRYPTIETCDLVIVNRFTDLIALLRHDITYGVLCYDTFLVQDNVLLYESTTNEKKKCIHLDWRDQVWMELQYMNIKDAKTTIENKKEKFIANNASMQYKLAKLHGFQNEQYTCDTKSLKKIVSSIPSYINEYPIITSHLDIVNDLIKVVEERHWLEISNLETKAIEENPNTKTIHKLQKFFNTNANNINSNDKLRLIVIFFITCFHKLPFRRYNELMELAKLNEEEKKLLSYLESIVGIWTKKPILNQTLIGYLAHSLHQGQLSEEEYPFINKLSSNEEKLIKDKEPKSSPQPLRWVGKTHVKDNVECKATSEDKKVETQSQTTSISPCNNLQRQRHQKKKLVIFVVGGISNSELGTIEKLAFELKHQLILGSTHLEDPSEFLHKLQSVAISKAH